MSTATMTITSVQTVHNMTLKVLTPLERIKNDVNGLVKSMLASDICDSTAQKEIVAWEEAFLKQYLGNLNTDDNRFQASTGLAVLLYESIRPALNAKKEDLNAAVALLGFEDEIKKILESTIPSGTDVDTFLTAYEEDVDQEGLVNKKLDAIDAIFQEQMKELGDSAKNVHASSKNIFEQLKKHLQEVTKKRLLMSEEAGKGMKAINTKLDESMKAQQELAKKIQNIIERIQKQQSISEAVLKDCEKLLQRI